MMHTLIIALLGLALAPQEAESASANPPADPWVFRSVLDGHARMLTAKLSEDLWVAYDTGTCGLYGAWSGGVSFEGAVYDTVHGPQPTVKGPFLLGPVAGEDVPAPTPWRAVRISDGMQLNCSVRYRGYKLGPTGWPDLELHWQITLPEHVLVNVWERPARLPADESVWSEDIPGERIGVSRTFKVVGVPDDVRLQVFGGHWMRPNAGGTFRTGAGVDAVLGKSLDLKGGEGGAKPIKWVPWPDSEARDDWFPVYYSFGDGLHRLSSLVIPGSADDNLQEGR